MDMMLPEEAWSVSALTRYVRDLIESSDALRGIWVQGEVSNLSRPRSGHIYFTLKDARAALKCVIWRSQALKMGLDLQDGLAVMAYGSLSVYETGGQYQLLVQAVRPVGEGGLYAEFLRLKARLEAEGLFAPEHKQALPPLPRRIGVVTSATGAALQDILNTLRRRYPLAQVVLSPSLVQGEGAPEALVRSLVRLMTRAQVDVIIIARGGGSLEDLWAFNDERVVRTVAASPVPIISGVGHETDFTLTDFAADRRAPTPTAAAEMATPITRDALWQETELLAERLDLALHRKLEAAQEHIRRLQRDLAYIAPQRRVQRAIQDVDNLAQRLERLGLRRVQESHRRMDMLQARLEALNPRAVLRRGYAILQRRDNGAIISSRAAARAGLRLRALLSDGTVPLIVDEVSDDEG